MSYITPEVIAAADQLGGVLGQVSRHLAGTILVLHPLSWIWLMGITSAGPGLKTRLHTPYRCYTASQAAQLCLLPAHGSGYMMHKKWFRLTA